MMGCPGRPDIRNRRRYLLRGCRRTTETPKTTSNATKHGKYDIAATRHTVSFRGLVGIMRSASLFAVALLAIVLALSSAQSVSAQQITLTVVSDASTEWSSDGVTWSPAVATWVHPTWPSIEGATYIWRTAQTDAAWEYANAPIGGWYFQKTFEVPGCGPMSGTIWINADNSESVSINGHFLGQDGSLNRDGPPNNEWLTVLSYDLTPYLHTGTNTISIRAINYGNSGSAYTNPAGLIFKAVITYNPDCPAVGGVVIPTNALALPAPWLAVIGLIGCVGTVVVITKKRR